MKVFDKIQISLVTAKVEREIKKIVSKRIEEKHWVTHYGANDIHPKHLVYWICVQSDEEKNKLREDKELMKQLRELLTTHNYPEEGRDGVYIDFESQETVDRESDGHWWHHWK